MNVKNKWKALPLSIKFTIMISTFVVIMVMLLGLTVYQSRKNHQLTNNTARMTAHTNDLYSMLELNLNAKRQSIRIAMPLAEEVLENAGTLSLDTNEVNTTMTNQETGNSTDISFYPLMIDQESLLNNFTVVDQIMEKANVTATIFQRTGKGFLRISTNVRDSNGQRATGTYIPESSPAAQSLLNAETYFGRAFVVNDHYITAYQPIFVNGRVEGALYVGIPEKDLGFLEEKYLATSYLESGYPFLIDQQGNTLIHPTEQGSNIAQSDLFRKITESEQGSFIYSWPENDRNAAKRRLFYRYFEPYETYVAVSVSEYDFLQKTLIETRNLVLLLMIVCIIITIFLTRFIVRRITQPINEVASYLEKLSLGVQMEPYQTDREDELGTIAQSLNKLIHGLKATAVFANEIEKKNFDHAFTPLSEEDVMGNALIDMRKSLIKAEKEEEKRKEEDQKRNWTTEGLAKFSDIIRQDNDNLEVLSFNIIRNLVKYLNINQGGLFIINDEDEQDKFLELAACYAFDRQKFLTKKVYIGEGLTGTCYLEQQTIHLKQIPENYINITSGLGEASPGNLLIVPLKLNEQVYGVVELASFEEFQPHEIEFVEKIAESIASTLSSVKINMRTAMLLEQSQQQAEEMKAQEEEMRQNMEELEATQEEIARKSEEQKLKDERMQAELNEKVQELQAQEEVMRQTLISTEENQKEMEKVKEELHAMVDNMPGIVYQCLNDENFTMDFMSDYCEKITGFKADDFIGNKNVAYADLIHPDDIDRVNAAIEKAMKEKKPFYVEYRLRDKEGKHHKVGEHGSMMQDKHGEIHHLQGLVFALK